MRRGSASGEAGPVDEGSVDAEASKERETLDRQSAMLLENDFLDTARTMSEKKPTTDKDTALLASLSASRDASRHCRQSSAARNMAVCIAFDYMRVRVSQIKECKKLYPAIQAMFNEMEQRSEDKRAAEREKMEAQVNAKRGKKDKWYQEQGPGKQKKAKTTGDVNGEINPRRLMGEGRRRDAENMQAPIMDGQRDIAATQPA